MGLYNYFLAMNLTLYLNKFWLQRFKNLHTEYINRIEPIVTDGKTESLNEHLES